MSRPIVVTVCMDSFSESWEAQLLPQPWHSPAGGGAVHSIKSVWAPSTETVTKDAGNPFAQRAKAEGGRSSIPEAPMIRTEKPHALDTCRSLPSGGHSAGDGRAIKGDDFSHRVRPCCVAVTVSVKVPRPRCCQLTSAFGSIADHARACRWVAGCE